MANQLWNVTATRDNLTVKEGMNAEILIKNSTRKPNSSDIAEALNKKYGTIKSGSVNVHFFEIEKIG